MCIEICAHTCVQNVYGNVYIVCQVMGLVRGRNELGPRALGHRSLVAYPKGPNVKDIFNQIKGRQSFRPVRAFLKPVFY